MSTVSQGTDSSAAVAGAAGHEVELSGTYERKAPVEATIRPTAFVTLTVLIMVLVAVSLAAIVAGGSFDGGQPGITSPAER